MIKIHKDDLTLFLGGLFLICVILFCMFGPQWLSGMTADATEAGVSCDCPYCTGQLGSFNAVVLDGHSSASFVDPNTGTVYTFQYVDGEGLVGGPEGSIHEYTDEEDGQPDTSFGGFAGDMPTVDENGNTVYVPWANDVNGNPIEPQE